MQSKKTISRTKPSGKNLMGTFVDAMRFNSPYVIVKREDGMGGVVDLFAVLYRLGLRDLEHHDMTWRVRNGTTTDEDNRILKEGMAKEGIASLRFRRDYGNTVGGRVLDACNQPVTPRTAKQRRRRRRAMRRLRNIEARYDFARYEGRAMRTRNAFARSSNVGARVRTIGFPLSTVELVATQHADSGFRRQAQAFLDARRSDSKAA